MIFRSDYLCIYTDNLSEKRFWGPNRSAGRPIRDPDYFQESNQFLEKRKVNLR